MTIIYVEIEPESTELNVLSNLESLENDTLEHGRYITFSGKPKFSGTYRYTDINLSKDGNSITLPDFASVTVRETDSNPEIIGHVTYIENYSDSELGIKEPDRISAEVDYPYGQFEKAWNLVCNAGIGKLKITVAIKAPETDISGHEVILDINKTDSWPIDALYIKRYEKRT